MNWEQLLCEERIRPVHASQTSRDLRSEFEKDYHRIIGSASFRRLQDKTQVFPLDQYVDQPVSLMERVPGDNADVSIWKTYDKLIEAAEPRGTGVIQKLERFAFYEESKKAYAIIATSERSQYAHVILQKGCVL